MLITPAFAQTGGGAGGDFFIQLLPIIGILAIFYFLLIRPQQKKMKEHRQMVANIRRGDTVVTSGGIVGRVTRVDNENECLVEIADGVRVRIVSSTISDVKTKGEPAASD